MTFKKQIFLGILIILIIFLVLIFSFWFSHYHLSKFMERELYTDLQVARSYEQMVYRWGKLDILFEDLVETGNHKKISEIEVVKRDLDEIVTNLGKLVPQGDHFRAFSKISSILASYSWELENCSRYSIQKEKLVQRDYRQLASVAQELSRQAVALSLAFTQMKEDFSALLKSPEFQNSSSAANSFVQKISRIERDLVLTNEAVSIFALRGWSHTDDSREIDRRKTLGQQIQKRLQAVLSLIETSLQETKSPVQIRILNRIKSEIHNFRQTFSELHQAIDRPDGEVLEFEERIGAARKRMEDLRAMGLHLAIQEAEYFWNRIAYASQSLLDKSRKIVLAGIVCLICFLIGGIYALIVLPKKLAGPLQRLADNVSSFTLGKKFEKSESLGTQELVNLEKSFENLTTRLNNEVGANVRYINAIENLGQVYFNLENIGSLEKSYQERRLDNAIDQILEALINSIEGLDLIKVMILKETKVGDKTVKYFEKIGPTKVSARFEKSQEYAEYCKSVTEKVIDKNGVETFDEKIIPFEEGLTGYLYSNLPAEAAFSESDNPWQKDFEPLRISSVPTLANRLFERGLQGCIHRIPLKKAFTQVLKEIPDEEEEPIGLVFMYFSDPKTKISQQERQFAHILTRQISMIMESIELLKIREKQRKTDYQLELAKQIQESLLPRTTPNIPGLKISAVNKPAFEVGGDYFDHFILGQYKFGAVIADASGKNIPAALMMTVFKTVLATIDLTKMSAGEVLTHANKVILKNLTLEDRFITAMYVIIDLKAGEVELACAGHNPAIVVSGKGSKVTFSEWSGKGVPLGIIEMEYETSRFKIKPGDLILLYTDGVTEARNPEGEEFGLSRLKKFLTPSRGARTASDIYEEVRRFIGDAQQYDDITAMTIEYVGLQSCAESSVSDEKESSEMSYAS